MAAPFVTGAAALLMEWGIVFTAFSRAVSENTSKNTKYPNPVTGWGTLCLLDSIP